MILMSDNRWTDFSNYFKNNTIVAGFTNINYEYTPSQDRIQFASILGLDPQKIVKPKQIHSNKVVICHRPGQIEKIDGVVTNKEELVLSIQVADCIPIYLLENKNKILGLIHAGWRGISKGIVQESINKLNELNVEINEVEVLLGPSIRQCCFEVGPEVAELFNLKYQITGRDDRTYLDLQQIVIDQFEQNGILSKNINDAAICTHCSSDYHSYRRDGKQAGRMIAMLGFKNYDNT